MSNEYNLTPKQQIFCREYLVDRNATRAITEAGYSKKSADSQGSRMLKNVKVKAYIQQMTQDKAAKLDITFERILQEISNIAFFDIKNIFDGSSLKQIDQLSESTSTAISSIKSRIEKVDGENFAEIVEIKSNDKLKALDMLCKYTGLYEKDNDQKKTEVIEAQEPEF